MKTAIELPENPDELRQLTLKLMQDLEVAQKRMRWFEEMVRQAQLARFGRKTERFDANQLSLLDEDVDADISELEAQLANEFPDIPETKVKPCRLVLPETLPREESRKELDSNECPDCGEALRFVRDEVNEVLDYLPARFIVKKTIRPQYSCPCCQTIYSASLPAQIIDKSMAGPGLLTQVVINKVIDHLPLHRQQHIFAREGITLPSSTLSDWMGKVSVALQPLADRLQTLLLTQPVLHADETPLQLLEGKKGKAINGYLWCYASAKTSDHQIVQFDCQPGRGGQYARDYLNGYQGTLVVDDYAGYKALFADRSIKEAGCMAHVRRKFFELYRVNKNPVAKQALDTLRNLYRLERLIKQRPPDKKRHWQQRYAKPIFITFEKWLLLQQHQCAPNSGLHRAITYALKRYPSLRVYLDDGNVPIDNNHAENCIRPIALGRKNWLFAGSVRAGQRMATLMGLLHTARINGIEPFNWLRYVLTHLPSWKYNQLDKLLPLPSNTFDIQ